MDRTKLYWSSYYKKAECFKYNDIDDSIFVTRDLNEDNGMKLFMALELDDIDDVVKALRRYNYNLYEALQVGKPVKPYFDLEMEYIGLTPRLIEIKINNFIKWLIKEINFVFGVAISRDDLVILDSSRHEKLIYHIIITSKIYFASVADHKLFIKYLVTVFKECPGKDADKISRFKYTKANGKEGFIFDHIPYGIDQNVRFINQSKKGKNYILKSITPRYTIRDSFIRLYEGVGDRILLDVHNLDNSIFERSFCIPSKTPVNESSNRPKITVEF